MIRDERGSMSAFLAMLFLVFLLLISVCAEGIYTVSYTHLTLPTKRIV